MTKQSNFFKGSGNVFADLGLKDPEERLAKARLAHEISCVIEDWKLSQKEAAKILDTTQAKVSDVVRGKLSSFTIDRLIKMLLAFDQDVEISLKPKSRSRDHAVLTVHAT